MQINIWGSPFGNTGYAVHTRHLAGALSKIADVSIDAQPTVQANSMNALCEKPSFSDSAMIMINLPFQWQLRYAERINPLIGFGVWEGDKIHSSFVQHCNDSRLSAIFVPSAHTRTAFVYGGVEKDIEIIPHGVNTEIFKSKPIKKDLQNDFFNFLFVGGWRDGVNDRKGLDILLKAYTEEFKPKEKVLLTCKINMDYQDQNTIVNNIRALNLKPSSERREVGLIMTNVPEEMLADYYNAADCFVMPSKAEAFCLHPDTRIIENMKPKQIKDIKKGDSVITHKGRIRKVEEVKTRNYKGEMIVIQPNYFSAIKITPEHPVLCYKKQNKCRYTFLKWIKTGKLKPNWIPASSLSKGDILLYPGLTEQKITKIDRKDLKIKLTPDFCRLLGYYAAEGHIGKNGTVNFTFHKDEKQYHKDVISLLKKLFDVEPTIYVRSEKNTAWIYVCKSALTPVFEKLCGKGARNKMIPPEILNSSNKNIEEFLIGAYRGDGCYTCNTHSYSTISKNLSRQIALALIKLGGIPSIVHTKTETKNEYNIYHRTKPHLLKTRDEIKCSLGWNNGTFLHIPIREIRKEYYNGKVYNLEIEEDESYLTESFVVHNCMPVAESMACGCAPIVTNYGGQTDYVSNDNGLLVKIDGMATATAGVLYEETKWAIPSQKDLQESLRYAFDNQDEIKRRGKKAQKLIRTEYTWDITAKKVVDAIERMQTA